MIKRPVQIRQRFRVAFALFMILAVGDCHMQSLRAADKDALPAVGDDAADFELDSLAGKNVTLSDLVKDGPVVLVALRGFPGYQCPLCTAQVAQLLGREKAFREVGATVVMVYPGSAGGLNKHAAEFAGGKKLPANFHLLLDPDYVFTKAWHLRWDAPGETAYPSTFVIDAERKIRFAKISKTHGDRARVDDVLKALPPQK